MNRATYNRTARLLLAFALCIANCAASAAYEMPLTVSALHEAYVLGQRNDQATAAFLSPYMKQITEGFQAPHIAEIEILTPFAQVVDLSRQSPSGYIEEQAVREYHHRGNTMVFPLPIIPPPAYPKPDPAQNEPPPPPPQSAPPNTALQPENFWQNFRFETKQHDKTIASRSIRNKPIYSTPTKDTPAELHASTAVL